MLLKTSFPYTGGFLCCPNKMVRFIGTIPGLRYPGEKGGSEEEKEEKDPIKARETIGRSGG